MDLTRLPDVRPRPRRVAVGTFDGVHLGHREVIRGADTVLTFDPHPASVVSATPAPQLLTSLSVKAERIATLGVRELVVVPFDAEFAARSAQAFIDDVLVGALSATHVSVGENFRFGHQALGNAALLSADQRFLTRVSPLMRIEGEVVSSSHIRRLVQAGEVQQAGRLLGAPFQMRGEVLHGDARGRELGYPTANLVPDPALVCPAHGVYACLAGDRAAAVSVGVRPTFGADGSELVEAYLLDVAEDLYGRELALDYLVRLRGEQRYDSVAALTEQMALDVEQTRDIASAERSRR